MAGIRAVTKGRWTLITVSKITILQTSRIGNFSNQASLNFCYKRTTITDETGRLLKEERKRLGVETTLWLLPWQNADEELAPLAGKPYDYDF